MARSRNLKPGFFKNEQLAECSPLARVLFPGLWCLADREGRLEDRPKRIRAEILPYDDGSVDDMLEELHRAGFILRYEVDGRRFIQVVNFAKHQNPHINERLSIIPAPGSPPQAADEIEARQAQAPEQHRTSTVQAPERHSSTPADSLLLIPDSLNPPTEVPTTSGASAPPADSGQGMQAKIPAASADPIFGDCLAFLIGKGTAAKGARSFLGLMRKNHGDAALVQAIERAEREDITDPIPWVRKYLESRTNAVGTGGEIGGISRRIFA